jgi:hypothetical protein
MTRITKRGLGGMSGSVSISCDPDLSGRVGNRARVVARHLSRPGGARRARLVPARDARSSALTRARLSGAATVNSRWTTGASARVTPRAEPLAFASPPPPEPRAPPRSSGLPLNTEGWRRFARRYVHANHHLPRGSRNAPHIEARSPHRGLSGRPGTAHHRRAAPTPAGTAPTDALVRQPIQYQHAGIAIPLCSNGETASFRCSSGQTCKSRIRLASSAASLTRRFRSTLASSEVVVLRPR